MKWMEIIAVRTTPGNQKLLKKQLGDLIIDVKKNENKQAIGVYNCVTVDTDFNIHLFHDSETIEENGSSLGLYLASAFKKFGFVNHSVWSQES